MTGILMSGKYPITVETLILTMDELFSHQGKDSLAELLRHSDASIDWEHHDEWQGGTDYYTLNLRIPVAAFVGIEATRDAVENLLLQKVEIVTRQFERDKIGKLVIVPDRRLATKRAVPPVATKRIWGEGGFRLFLSHKAEVKKQTAELKENLLVYGIASFVAHSDIRPTKAWQDEIENALSSMDGFAALMTANFHESDWTDQEVGFAFARNVPIVAVKLGRDPYGFIGKFQALSCSWATAPEEIAKVLIKNDRMVNAYVNAVQNCSQFEEGNRLAAILPDIEELTDAQADTLISAYNENVEVNGSFGFNGSKPHQYGDGLLFYLKRLNKRKYKLTPAGNIKVKL
jgi:TIR domain